MPTATTASSSSTSLIDQTGKANKKNIIAALGAELKKTKKRAEALQETLDKVEMNAVKKDNELNELETSFRAKQQKNFNDIMALRKEVSSVRRQLEAAVMIDSSEDLEGYLSLLGHDFTTATGNSARNRMSSGSSSGGADLAIVGETSRKATTTTTPSSKPFPLVSQNTPISPTRSTALGLDFAPTTKPALSRAQERKERVEKNLEKRSSSPEIPPFHVNPTPPIERGGGRGDKNEKEYYTTEGGVRIGNGKRGSILGRVFGGAPKRKESESFEVK